MVACIHPVSIHGAQILDLKLDQGTSELCGVPKVLRELVGLELIAAAEDVHQQLNHSVHWRQGVREEDKPDYDGEFLVETERLIETFVVDKD